MDAFGKRGIWMGGGEDTGWFLGRENIELNLKPNSSSSFLTIIFSEHSAGSERTLTK